ncbi:30S ribosomal protein S13 [Candidatus Saccharibacteria bacterium]|nr:MAG: 30S ribosomal protein S13 [Candidatus Saccharibacteria bacterium]
MARIAGVTIPTEKQVQISLTYIFGIGPVFAARILEATNVNPTTRVRDLTETELTRLREEINAHYTVEGDLQRVVAGNIKRLKEINSYRGLRHKNNLPAHGQRTRTNARTRRGKKTTVGGTKKKVASKT